VDYFGLEDDGAAEPVESFGGLFEMAA